MNTPGLQPHPFVNIAPPGTGTGAAAFGEERRQVTRKRTRADHGVRQLTDGRWQWFYTFAGRLHRHRAESEEEAERDLAAVKADIWTGAYREGRTLPRGLKKLADGRWQYSWDYRKRYHRMIAPTRAIAEASLAKVRAMIAEGKYLEKEEKPTVLFETAVKEFRTWGTNNVSTGQVRRDKESSDLWLAFPRFRGKTLGEITVADCEAYRNWRLGAVGTRTKGKVTFNKRPAGKRTCDLDLARLRRLFVLCIEWKYCKENPAKGVKFFNPESKHDRFLTPNEEARILEACPPDVRPAMVFAVNTGIRQGELVSLTWGQVDIQRKIITLTADKTKTKRTRRVPLNAPALEALKSLPRGIAPTATVFPVIAGRDHRDLVRRFKWAVEKTKINEGVIPSQRVTWHTLRHTFASRLVQAGVNLLTVQRLLGHTTLAMVQQYAHLADTHLQAAVDTLAESRNLQTTCNRPGEGSQGGGA